MESVYNKLQAFSYRVPPWRRLHSDGHIMQPMKAIIEPRIIRPKPMALLLAHVGFIASVWIGLFLDL